MKRFVLILLLLTSALRAGDALIVLKSGECIAGHNVVKKGAAVAYTADGKKGKKSMTAVYKILPKMARETKYSQAKIKAAIKDIKTTQAKFPKLKHLTKAMLDEWLTLQKVSGKKKEEGKASLEKRIGVVVDTYEKSERTAADFRKLRSDLDLLQYEDVKGHFKKQVEEVFAPLCQEFFADKVEGLQEAAIDKTLSTRDFAEINGVAQDLLQAGPDTKTATKIKTSLEGTRRACLDYQLGRAKTLFREKPTISSYMKANSVLFNLQDRVANAAQQSEVTTLRTQMQGSLTDYNFGIKGMKGFPVNRSDLKYFDKLRNFRVIWGAKAPKHPPALIYPASHPSKGSLKEKKLLRFRAVFRSRPPKRLGYAIRPAKIFMPYPKVKILGGHADIPVLISFEKMTKQQLAEMVGQITGKGGRKVIMVELVEWRKSDEGKVTYSVISNAVPVVVE